MYHFYLTAPGSTISATLTDSAQKTLFSLTTSLEPSQSGKNYHCIVNNIILRIVLIFSGTDIVDLNNALPAEKSIQFFQSTAVRPLLSSACSDITSGCSYILPRPLSKLILAAYRFTVPPVSASLDLFAQYTASLTLKVLF